MRNTKFLACFLLFWGCISNCIAQETMGATSSQTQPVYLKTVPNATLYGPQQSLSDEFPSTRRTLNNVSNWKKKNIKRPTELEYVDMTNINKVAEYDAYVIKFKDKYYLISSSDIEDNTYLEIKSNEIMRKYEELRSLAASNAPDMAFSHLMDLAQKRIKYYEDSISYLLNNKEEIIATRAKARAENRVQEEIRKYNGRREKYNSWVSTLPASVQRDARLLAIPRCGISSGYFGVCGFNMYFINMSPQKTIKYLTWSGRVKNAVGDYISCEMRHTSSFSGKYTGPCEPLNDEYATWDGVLYNSSAELMVLTSVTIIYMDGSSVSIGKNSLDYLTNIPGEVFSGDVFNYSMSSGYEDGYDLDIEINNYVFLHGSEMEQELNQLISRLRDSAQLYREAKDIFTKNKNSLSILNAYLDRGSIMFSIRDDNEFITSARDYYNSLKEKGDAQSKLLEFTKKYLGFIY